MRSRRSVLLLLFAATVGVVWWLLPKSQLSKPPEAAIAATAQVAAPTVATPAQPVAEPAPAAATPDYFTTEKATVGTWRGRMSAPLISLARAQAEENAPRIDRIALRLSNARSGVAVIDGFQPTEEDGGVFTGILEGYPGSTVVLSYVGGAQAGVVLIPAESRAFNIRGGDDGVVEILELDTRLAPGCGDTPHPPRS